MRGRRRALIIGSTTLRDELAQLLPEFDCAAVERPLEAVWQSGHEPFELILIPLQDHPPLGRVLHSLRQVAPRARLIVSATPPREPLAIAALDCGADDYVLLPLQARELRRAVGADDAVAPDQSEQKPAVTSAAAGRDALEVLTQALQAVEHGPADALPLLTALLRRMFGAAGVRIEFGELVHTAGELRGPTISQVLEGAEAGRVTVAGALSAATGQNLAGYARLLATVLAHAHSLAHARRQAETDELSTLNNRRAFERKLGELLTQAANDRQELSVLLFDLDNFKDYNDRYGHETGDHVIREVSKLLRACTRETDVLARYGGDEFAVVFSERTPPRTPGSRHPENAVAVVERFRAALLKHDFKLLGATGPGTLTISGGLATFPWDAKSPADLLRAADMALLEAKRTGKNSVRLGGGLR